MQVIEIKCPGCGERLSMDMKTCPSCHGPVVISSVSTISSMTPLQINKYASTYKKALNESPNDVSLNTSVAMCYLSLKLYSNAIPAFEKAMEDNFEDSETFYYAALCLLQGKKAFVQSRAIIDKVIEYVNAAIMIEPRPIYYYFLAYIKYDFFARKSYGTAPNYQECLAMAMQGGLSEADVSQMYSIIGTERPSCL